MRPSTGHTLLDSISKFCKQQKIAESTFGRRAVNDGKFVSRLRNGSRVTPETWERVNRFIEKNGGILLAKADPQTMHLISANHKVWPDEMPFSTGRHEILHALKLELGADAGKYNFSANSDARSIFCYKMHALPTEISASIGTSTLFAAWNAAVYVAQIEDERHTAAMSDNKYLEATNEVLIKYGGLWFNDESYILSRRKARKS